MNTTTTITTEDLLNRLVIVPQWIERQVRRADRLHRKIVYTYKETPFGTYPMGVEIACKCERPTRIGSAWCSQECEAQAINEALTEL